MTSAQPNPDSRFEPPSNGNLPPDMHNFAVAPGFASSRPRRPGQVAAASWILLVLAGLAIIGMVATLIERLAFDGINDAAVGPAVNSLGTAAACIIAMVYVRSAREGGRLLAFAALGAVAWTALGTFVPTLTFAVGSGDFASIGILTLLLGAVLAVTALVVALLHSNKSADWFQQRRSTWAVSPVAPFNPSATAPVAVSPDLTSNTRSTGRFVAAALFAAVAMAIVGEFIMQTVTFGAPFEAGYDALGMAPQFFYIGILVVSSLAVITFNAAGFDLGRALAFVLTGILVSRAIGSLIYVATSVLYSGIGDVWYSLITLVIIMVEVALGGVAIFMLGSAKTTQWFYERRIAKRPANLSQPAPPMTQL